MGRLDPDRVLCDVGRRIAELRAARGWTQEGLAERLGVGAKYVQGVERGTENLTLRTLARVAEELGTRPIALLRRPLRDGARPGRPRKESLPFEETEPGPSDFYRTCVPLVTLEASAGPAAPARLVETTAWVKPRSRRKLGQGMFVARIVGDSMEPTLSQGAFGLFRSASHRPEAGAVVLAARTEGDEAAFVVKRLSGTVRRARLSSDNPAHPPIPLDGWMVVAVLLETLG